MIYLKQANLEDAKKEYLFLQDTPADESGYENRYYGCTYQEFVTHGLPQIIHWSKGIDLPNGYVPETSYFLWHDNNIVGLFKIRHYLTDALKQGAGHIGYGIHKNHRGKGYATKGLALMINMAKSIIKEDVIYLSVHKDNPASLKVQLNNGAIIHHSDEVEHYTRIKL